MAYLILSSGTLAGPALRTIRSRTVAVVASALLVIALCGGVALGFRLGQSTTTDSLIGLTPLSATNALDPGEPGDKLLIDRVGMLSGRLIRLESEALNLARQVGVAVPKASTAMDSKDKGRAAVSVSAMSAATAIAERVVGAATAAGANPLIDVDVDVDVAATEPSGGPLVEAVEVAGGNVGPLLARLARDLDRIDATFAQVAEAAVLRSLASMAFPSRRPIDGGSVSSGFGNRRDPFTRRLARHTGLDFRAPHGAPIHASAGGRVSFAGYRGAYGKTIEIDHGNGLKTRYGHASKLYVRSGDVVLPGQRIAAVGSTGRSTGAHLHFEVLRNGTQVEPRLYLARREPAS